MVSELQCGMLVVTRHSSITALGPEPVNVAEVVLPSAALQVPVMAAHSNISPGIGLWAVYMAGVPKHTVSGPVMLSGGGGSGSTLTRYGGMGQ